MQAFHDVRFPLSIGFGATGGIEWVNEIVMLTSGREKRNQRRAASRRRYDVGTGLRSISDLEVLSEFFEARRGTLHAFRFCDPFDWKSCKLSEEHASTDQQIGLGDASTTEFSLTKKYGAGEDSVLRRVSHPAQDTVRLAIDGQELVEGLDFTVQYTTGQVTLSAPPDFNSIITAGFQFDIPVRFDTEFLALSLDTFQAGQSPTVPLLEVRI